jgi:hypothetical protein
MNSRRDDTGLAVPGCPIRKSPDQRLLSGSPKLIAASHVLRRLLAPRHSPCALSSLTTMQEHPCACTRRLPVHTIQLSKSRTAGGASLATPARPGKHLTCLPRAPDAILRQVSHLPSGADGHRTHDPRLAKPVLSQLSYSPLVHDPRNGPR